jgi:nucleotide-binding universal stress UspA family protein
MSETIVGEMRTVVVATDFSFTADRALDHARELARRAGADLRLVHALLPGEKGTSTAELEARLRHLLAEVELASCLVREGRPAETILAEAATSRADLIVIGADGLDHGRRPHLGSTVRRVIEHATCPVLVVHAADHVRGRRPQRILVATDFSEGARGALRRAARLLGISSHDTVVLAHAYNLSPTVDLAVAPFTRPEIDGLVRQEAARQLDQDVAAFRQAGMQPRAELLDGFPVEAVVARAQSLDADLVVTGTLGRSGLAHLLLGSTAERVVERAPCPVLVVPAAAVERALEDSGGGEVTTLAGAVLVDEQG